jgi:hypothetical protein
MLKFLSGSVLQAAADAFATAELATGLANANLAYRIRGIVVAWPSPVEVDSDCAVQILRRTPSALVGLGDRTLIYAQQRLMRLTTSGIFEYDIFTETFYPKDLDFLIVEDPIFLSIDSSSTGAANSAAARIYYEEVRITALEKVTSLAESLNA